MAKRPKIDVFLTSDAIQLLNNEPTFQLFLTNNKYLTCESAEQNGYFVDLVVPCPKKSIKISDIFLSIPCNYVLYMLTGDSNKILGFAKPDRNKNADAEE